MNVTNEVVFNQNFAGAFSKLLKMPFPATVSLELVATFKALNEQQKNVFAVRDALLDRLARKTENGQLVFENGSIAFLDKDSQDEFYREMDGLIQLEFEIPLRNKLKLDDRIQISAEEIMILQPILDLNV